MFIITMGDLNLVRTVYGYITGKKGNPAANVRVKAFDNDTWPNPDDLMGITMTDSNGYYEIHYAAGHWDTAPHRWTIWRPDIFIRVSAPVNGRCDDGKWKSDKNWIHCRDSGVKSNHKLRNNLRKDLKLLNYPLDNVEVHTFQRGVDMWSESDFFVHGSAFGCAPNGDKVEWGYWGIGGPPKFATRCWHSPKNKCTTGDYEKIKNLGLYPLPAEVENAHNMLIESDDIDEDAEKVFSGVLKEIKQYWTEDNTDKAREMMKKFKQLVIQENEKGSITQKAKIVLLTITNNYLKTIE